MIFPAIVYIDQESMGANVIGIPFRIEEYTIYCMQPSWTGAPVGSLKIQGSLDFEEPYTWIDLPEGTVNVNGPGSTLFNYSQVGWLSTRMIYTRSSGSGSLTVKLTAK